MAQKSNQGFDFEFETNSKDSQDLQTFDNFEFVKKQGKDGIFEDENGEYFIMPLHGHKIRPSMCWKSLYNISTFTKEAKRYHKIYCPDDIKEVESKLEEQCKNEKYKTWQEKEDNKMKLYFKFLKKRRDSSEKEIQTLIKNLKNRELQNKLQKEKTNENKLKVVSEKIEKIESKNCEELQKEKHEFAAEKFESNNCEKSQKEKEENELEIIFEKFQTKTQKKLPKTEKKEHKIKKVISENDTSCFSEEQPSKKCKIAKQTNLSFIIIEDKIIHLYMGCVFLDHPHFTSCFLNIHKNTDIKMYFNLKTTCKNILKDLEKKIKEKPNTKMIHIINLASEKMFFHLSMKLDDLDKFLIKVTKLAKNHKKHKIILIGYQLTEEDKEILEKKSDYEWLEAFILERITTSDKSEVEYFAKNINVQTTTKMGSEHYGLENLRQVSNSCVKYFNEIIINTLKYF